MTRYAVTAEVTRTIDVGPAKFEQGWTQHRSLPTFYLDSEVQGITSTEHAEKIAREVVNPFGEFEVYVCAVLVTEAVGPLNRCEKCGQEFYYPPASHRCPGEWEAACEEAGAAPLVSSPYVGMTWVEECMAKQRGTAK